MEDLMRNLPQEDIGKLLDVKGEKRLSSKIARMRNLLKIAQSDEALYREIMLSLGYKNNKVQFLELAMILPYSEICSLKERDRIEKAMLYRSGFLKLKEGLPEDFDFSLKMARSVWKYKSVRPANFPERRIKSISYLLSESCESGLFEFFRKRIVENYKQPVGKSAKAIVSKIIFIKGIGKMRGLEIFFNILLPFYKVIFEMEGKRELIKFLDDLYLYHPALSDNSITKSIKKELFSDTKDAKVVTNSVKRYMGLIQLYYEKNREEEYDNS